MDICPKCKSRNINIVDEQFIVCSECGFDEGAYGVSEQRSSQKAKAEHSPYKTGGSKRTQK